MSWFQIWSNSFPKGKQLLKSRTSGCGLRQIILDEPAVPWITLDYSGLLWIAPNYLALLRFTWFTPVYSGLLRFTSDYCALLRITPIFLNYSRLFRFTVNYCGLLRITPDYTGLFQINPILRITSSDHQVVQWITRVVSLPGLPRITADYAELPEFTPYLLGLLQFTPTYFGLLQINRITSLDHQDVQRVTRVFSPRDFRGLRRITPDYSGSLGLLQNYPG